MKIYVKAMVDPDYFDIQAERCYRIMMKLRKLSDGWKMMIGDPRWYKQYGTYCDENVFDMVDTLIDVDEDIWEMDDALEYRDELITIMDGVNSYGT